MSGADRCASHPGRPAVDECPVCSRPRCGAEQHELGAGGCAVCVAERRAIRPELPVRVRVIAAAIAGLLVAVVGGAVSSEYVGAQWFDLAAPALTGIAVGIVATAVARTRGKGPLDWPLRGFAAVLAVLGTALSFRLVPGGDSPFTPVADVIPPYLAAIGGALASRLLR